MKKIFKIFLVCFLLFEIIFSFKRHFYFPIDGDLPSIVAPHKNYEAVLQDPFGINVLLHDSVYAAPNRFFSHWFMWTTFNHVPLLLQYFTSPVNSVYYSCALAKTFIQFFILYLFSVYVTGKKRFWNYDSLLVMVFLVPLFQVFGYNDSMGIIDHSITYTFFYAFSLSLVLFPFLSFFLSWFYKSDISKFTVIGLLLLTIAASLNGPLNAPAILLICPLLMANYFFHHWKQHPHLKLSARISHSIKNIPPSAFFILCFSILTSLYSLYIGRNNSEDRWESISVSERYSRLWTGFYDQYAVQPGPALLLGIILINSLIIKKYFDESGKKILSMLKWFLILAIIYILLLPLGGYRPYRPNIIRNDTILPVTFGLILLFGITTYHIHKRITFKRKKIYWIMIIFVTAIFIHADTDYRKYNACERRSLEKISLSMDKIVLIEEDCPVLSWGKITDYKDSEVKGVMLHRWNVTKESKLFYQK